MHILDDRYCNDHATSQLSILDNIIFGHRKTLGKASVSISLMEFMQISFMI